MSRIFWLFGIMAGALTGNADAQTPAAACSLPADPGAIPAAIDAAITGPADKDRSCMKELLLPEARLVVASSGADGALTYTALTLDDWIARVAAQRR
jgi:hypothetical protein